MSEKLGAGMGIVERCRLRRSDAKRVSGRKFRSPTQSSEEPRFYYGPRSSSIHHVYDGGVPNARLGGKRYLAEKLMRASSPRKPSFSRAAFMWVWTVLTLTSSC